MDYNKKRKLIIGIAVFILFLLYALKNFSIIIRAIGFIAGIIIFYLIDHLFKINFEFKHYIYLILILFFGILLAPLYFFSENYDKMLHLISPILGGCLIFYMIDNKKLNFQWKLLITFMFIVSFLTIHEIGEYFMDWLWDMKLQGVYIRDISGIEKLNLVLNPHDDTMIDLIFGTIGGIIFAIGKTINHLYEKRKSITAL